MDNNIKTKDRKAALLFAMSVLVILSLSAFSYPTSISSQKRAFDTSNIKPLYGAFHLKPGQDIWVHLPVKDVSDPHSVTVIHVQLSSPTAAATANAASANSSGCLRITDRETGYENSGSVAFWYQIALTFCYNGTDVTSITIPTASWWTNTFYGIYNFGTVRYNEGAYGWGEGDYSECYLGCIQQSDGYVEIEVYGYGGYSARGDI